MRIYERYPEETRSSRVRETTWSVLNRKVVGLDTESMCLTVQFLTRSVDIIPFFFFQFTVSLFPWSITEKKKSRRNCEVSMLLRA